MHTTTGFTMLSNNEYPLYARTVTRPLPMEMIPNGSMRALGTAGAGTPEGAKVVLRPIF